MLVMAPGFTFQYFRAHSVYLSLTGNQTESKWSHYSACRHHVLQRFTTKTAYTLTFTVRSLTARIITYHQTSLFDSLIVTGSDGTYLRGSQTCHDPSGLEYNYWNRGFDDDDPGIM